MQIIPVILSGGSGTRLWPLSRTQCPKQYLNLNSNYSMLQETIMRLSGIKKLMDPIIICNSEHRFLVSEQCHQINIKNPTIILEPSGRNTAPAIAAAAMQFLKQADDAVLLVLSADHVIQNVEAFHNAINIATIQAKQGRLATFGILPTNANTGYGYIKAHKSDLNGASKVKEFVEKPDLKTAEKYIELGDYLWNSGMFMFKATKLIDELSIYSKEVINSVTGAINNAEHDLGFIRLEKNAFDSSPSISIDFALLEKSKNVVVVPLDAEWNDVGTWSALYDIAEKDNFGNAIKGDVYSKDTTNSYIYASNHLVAVVGVDDLVVVETPDVTFISSKDKVHEVKSIVKSLIKNDRDEANSNRKVYRPWGWYNTIEAGKHFQVKILHVNPFAKLSLQMHHKRAEHWVVVSGTATVINGDETLTLNEGESTYIPVGRKHSLENTTNQKLEIIEVQSGTYLGEDDIVRFEDIYGRVSD